MILGMIGGVVALLSLTALLVDFKEVKPKNRNSNDSIL